MQFLYEERSRKPGIYEITNTITGGVYIGSASRFKRRWGAHAHALAGGTHSSKHLQASFNKYRANLGHDDFLVFRVLEVMEGSTKQERLVREEHWITLRRAEGIELYNAHLKPTQEPKKAGSSHLRNSPATEYKPGNVPWTKEHGHSEDTKQIISKRALDMWKIEEVAEKLRSSRRTEEFRSSHAEMMRERWKTQPEKMRQDSEEQRQAQSERLKQQWADPIMRQKLLDARKKREK